MHLGFGYKKEVERRAEIEFLQSWGPRNETDGVHLLGFSTTVMGKAELSWWWGGSIRGSAVWYEVIRKVM